MMEEYILIIKPSHPTPKNKKDRKLRTVLELCKMHMEILKVFFLVFMCVNVFVCMSICVPCECLVPKVRRGHQVP